MQTGFVITNTGTSTPTHNDIPETGDESNLLLYLLIMIFSGIMMIAMILLDKKRPARQKA